MFVKDKPHMAHTWLQVENLKQGPSGGQIQT
jgi:hypothetical protein